MATSETPLLDEIVRYANDCIDGAIVSGKKHKWACRRLLRDLERVGDEDFPYVWDEEEASGIVEWFHLLKHSKGILAGKPIDLTPWQKFRLCQLYGWRHRETGYKRFRKTFTEVARKNAKSQEEAGVALYEISVMSTRNREIYEYYTAGVKHDQSKIVFSEAVNMLKESPLRPKFKITQAAIFHIKTGSYIKALSKDDGKSGDGTNPAGLILDEYHQHPTTEFYDLSIGSNTKEPLLMIITTAGVDLTYPCYTAEYQYCSRILDPDNHSAENDAYLVDICELDPEDYADLRDVGKEENWLKANPIRATYPEGLEKIREDYRVAKEIPAEHMAAFLTKAMNVWVQARENGYMDMSKWSRCEVAELPIDIKGMSVYVGFDMSAKIDLTSVAFVIPFKSGERNAEGDEIIKYIVFSHSFIPNRQKLAERITKDKQPYDMWEKLGYITVTETEIIDQSAVMRYVERFCREKDLHIEMLCFDPANAGKLMMDMSAEGYDVEEVFQSYKSLNESSQGFREQVYSRNILYLENPVLTYAMSNAVTRQNNGLIKIDKDATTKRIDPVDAVLCAYKLAMYHEFGNSFWDDISQFLDMDEEG
ncbi:MAG: terminase large subunit [Lachnospiraceae bacterium]|nr:terminase large subunit [Lachnospiraceae bacterium]